MFEREQQHHRALYAVVREQRHRARHQRPRRAPERRRARRSHAREQIQHFIEVYVHCLENDRNKRLRQQEITDIAAHLYEVPLHAELNIDTSLELIERSALRIISYVEQRGFIAPLWEELDTTDEETAIIMARLQSLGYLD